MPEERVLYKDERTLYEYYGDAFLCFSYQLSVSEENLYRLKDVLISKLHYRVLPFRVWNHLFLCERSQFNPDMCRLCTKLNVSNKKVSDYINENSYMEIDYFPTQLAEGIVSAKKIYLFAHTNLTPCREDPFAVNLGGLYYESISSSFLLWKFYFNLLDRIVFNICQCDILPLLILKSFYGNYRIFTVCNSKNCRNLILNRIKKLFYKEMVDFSI